MKLNMTLEEALEPYECTCAKCKGIAMMYPYLTKDKEIKAICWCKTCSPKE